MPIRHVSDTARWVARYRAMETARPDALFHDPFADRLAGSDGEALLNEIPKGRAIAPALIVRTAVFDELIMDRVVHHHVDLVLNLAAGLDARPWRLQLPPTLEWVDADFAEMIAYKTEQMRGEAPACHYRGVAVDLTVASERDALFERYGALHQRVLVITEGLLIYLEPDAVSGLATALHRQRSFRWWLADLTSPKLLQFIQRSHGSALQQAPFRFAPADGARYFEPFGWHEIAFRSAIEEGQRLRRELPRTWLWRLLGRFASPTRREEVRKMSGVVLLERQDESTPREHQGGA